MFWFVIIAVWEKKSCDIANKATRYLGFLLHILGEMEEQTNSKKSAFCLAFPRLEKEKANRM